jgi:hypothetical protein
MRNEVLITTIWVIFLMAGCGGNGGSSSAPQTIPTPLRTPVNVTSTKAIFTGTATAGTQYSFSLTGTDLQGNSWTGSFTLISDGITTFEGQSVTASRSILTLQKLGGAPASMTTTRYFLSPIGAMYKLVDSSGRLITVIAESPVPDVPLTGESATGTGSVSDGTTALIGWKLDPDVNGNSKLTFSIVTKAVDNSVVSLEDDSFFLDSFGNPFKLTVVSTTDGTTFTLSGNKN